MARLEFIDSDGQPQHLLIGQDLRLVMIGRNPDCHISTTNPSVSRNHGEITYRAGLYVLEDHDSSNGTMLNDEEITPRKLMVLQDQDVILCGEFEIRFHDDDEAEELAPAPPAPVQPQRLRPPARREDEVSGFGVALSQRRAGAQPPPEPDYPVREPGYATPQDAYPPPEPAYEPSEPVYPPPEPVYQEAEVDYQAQDPGYAPEEKERPSSRRRRLAPPTAGRAQGAAAAAAAAPSPKPTPVAAAPMPSAVDTAEIEALQARVTELEDALRYYEEKEESAEDITALEAEKDELKRQLEHKTIVLEEASANVAELNQKIGVLESKIRRQEVEIDNHMEKQIDLREQLAHQAKQIEEQRREINQRDHQIEDIEYEIRNLKESLEESSAGLGDKSEAISSLKAEISQKSRMIDELQRQLDITSYDLQQAQEQLEQVTSEFSGTGGEVDGLKRKISNLQDIISDKGQQLSDKEDELREVLDELEIYRDEDRGGTGRKLAKLQEEREKAEQDADASRGRADALQAETDALQEEARAQQQDIETLRAELDRARSVSASSSEREGELVAQLKRDNRDLRRQIDDLEARALGAGGNGAQVEALRRQVADLEEENDLLDARIAKLSRRKGLADRDAGASPEALRELKAENRKLRLQAEELKKELSKSGQQQAEAGLSGQQRETLQDIYDRFNSLAAKVAGDMDTAAFSASELKRLVELLERIDLSGLEGRDRRKLEMLMRDINPTETLDTLEEMMNSSMSSAKGARQQLRNMRGVLEV